MEGKYVGKVSLILAGMTEKEMAAVGRNDCLKREV